MKKLLKYFKGLMKEVIGGPFFKLLEATFELLVPLVMAGIIDVGIPAGDRGYIVKMGLLMVLLAVLGFSCTFVAQYFSAKAAIRFSSRVKQALFNHMLDFSFTEMDKVGSSTLITRLTSDINQIQSGVNITLRLFLRSPFIVLGAMVMAFIVNARAALVFVVTIPLLAIVVFGIMIWTKPVYKKVQQKLDRVTLKTKENLEGSRVIRAFNRENEEVKDFTEYHNELTDLQIFVGKISNLLNPLTFVIINIATLVLIYSGAVQVDSGVITQGEVIALVNYMSQILVELVKFANVIINITKSLACANRISAVLDISSSMEFPEEEVPENEQNRDKAVSFENVALKYASAGMESIENVNFEASKGQTIGIIGGTGSGKTTFINLLSRFYDATEGTVKIDDVDIRKYTKNQIRSKIGVVMQKSVLFAGTIRDNMKWGNENATDEQIIEALKVANAYDFVMQKENKLDEMLTEGATNLSGGQKQRLCIARAVLKEPEILVLDDSTSALDFVTDYNVRQAIKNLAFKPTLFIVSQRTSSISNADNIIVLDDGKVVGIGKHDELLSSCEVYQEIYYSQYPKEEN